jgi:hypothetical protein
MYALSAWFDPSGHGISAAEVVARILEIGGLDSNPTLDYDTGQRKGEAGRAWERRRIRVVDRKKLNWMPCGRQRSMPQSNMPQNCPSGAPEPSISKIAATSGARQLDRPPDSISINDPSTPKPLARVASNGSSLPPSRRVLPDPPGVGTSAGSGDSLFDIYTMEELALTRILRI